MRIVIHQSQRIHHCPKHYCQQERRWDDSHFAPATVGSMVDPQACWPLSKALSYLHTEERCSEGLSRFDTNYGSYTHIVKEKLAEFHMTYFGPLNLKWKDPFSHDTVNFKPVHTWHHILILHLRNTFGVINNNFDVFQHNDLSLLFMFLEIEKKK